MNTMTKLHFITVIALAGAFCLTGCKDDGQPGASVDAAAPESTTTPVKIEHTTGEFLAQIAFLNANPVLAKAPAEAVKTYDAALRYLLKEGSVGALDIRSLDNERDALVYDARAKEFFLRREFPTRTKEVENEEYEAEVRRELENKFTTDSVWPQKR